MSHGSVTQPRQGDLWNSHDQHALAVLRPHESFIGDFEYEVVSKCEAVVLIGPKPFEDTRFRHPFDHLALNVVHHSLGRYFPRDFDETVLTGPQAEAARSGQEVDLWTALPRVGAGLPRPTGAS